MDSTNSMRHVNKRVEIEDIPHRPKPRPSASITKNYNQ
ncbi:hypothetical protein CEV33_0318 [Brucella grignonensis]|uniref:Uncharacterized protein n=1 Tax=Brucella grignonensis TaxID=94627 RepID=A0A256FFA9_9HYPH|nr:hypothetical protein CEV33_0318 [Brucella grignonensis]